ncbi:hypothetical protein NT6N_23730 [Oceaniferula spumae]|uniref:Lipocalin-like domain-containing protein n=1 Tax=Oceaniferula spumae TaxID=2979115 RepID=A0AAT9FN11_9BACT
MKNPAALFLIATFLLMACETRDSWPDPYAGYKHKLIEHGYWRELSSDEIAIRELHLHTEGYSITYVPFEYKKDYWGGYEWDADSNKLKLTVENGNEIPKNLDGVGTMRIDDRGDLVIEGVNLDGRRPRKKSFRFMRIHPER